ncbi:hypothetical protein GCM10010435_42520 [Winogradskya consettensis]|uniref:Uncharacterized protein n=1 Tax=Winogradskya consettensis TaxID=113560 RepID=A0A919SQT3_9ACTN|nr:hypothetical protein [Actinoplanes consettensis]GIM76640.1 hypothetical protein Aco04nite_51360 [Actinoplanes consettensis]
MAYVLRAVLGSPAVVTQAGEPLPLDQGLALVRIPPDLRLGDTDNRTLEAWSAAGPIAYVEAEYFAGTGSQFAVVCAGGDLVLGPLVQDEDDPPTHPTPISQALRHLGAIPGGHFDEFDAVGLGRYR